MSTYLRGQVSLGGTAALFTRTFVRSYSSYIRAEYAGPVYTGTYTGFDDPVAYTSTHEAIDQGTHLRAFHESASVITQETLSGSLAIPKTLTKYTSPGTSTWTKPTNCVLIKVQVVGGGGGAAGYWESGGSGGYAEAYLDVRNWTTASVTVGSGGGAVTYYASGGNGGTSNFGNVIYATGGEGANRNHQHSGGKSGFGYTIRGGVNLSGGGSGGHTNYAGTGSGRCGGSSYFGGAAGDRRDANNAKNGNGAPGAGGTGSRTDTTWAGAAGESGAVIIWEYYNH